METLSHSTLSEDEKAGFTKDTYISRFGDKDNAVLSGLDRHLEDMDHTMERFSKDYLEPSMVFTDDAFLQPAKRTHLSRVQSWRENERQSSEARDKRKLIIDKLANPRKYRSHVVLVNAEIDSPFTRYELHAPTIGVGVSPTENLWGRKALCSREKLYGQSVGPGTLRGCNIRKL